MVKVKKNLKGISKVVKKTRKSLVPRSRSAKTPVVPQINFDELYEKVKKLLDKDKENFILVAYSEDHNYFVIVHKKTLTTKKVNENSVFQPVTFEESKDFPIPFIIWVSYTKEEPEFIKDMKNFNTIVLKCLPMDDFKDKIKRYVLKD